MDFENNLLFRVMKNKIERNYTGNETKTIENISRELGVPSSDVKRYLVKKSLEAFKEC